MTLELIIKCVFFLRQNQTLSVTLRNALSLIRLIEFLGDFISKLSGVSSDSNEIWLFLLVESYKWSSKLIIWDCLKIPCQLDVKVNNHKISDWLSRKSFLDRKNHSKNIKQILTSRWKWLKIDQPLLRISCDCHLSIKDDRSIFLDPCCRFTIFNLCIWTH